MKNLLQKAGNTRADRANRRLWQKVDQYEKEVENARTDLERIKRRQKESASRCEAIGHRRVQCSSQNEEPIAERDDKCQWVVGKGCLPAERVEDPLPKQLEGMAQEQLEHAEGRLEEAEEGQNDVAENAKNAILEAAKQLNEIDPNPL